jgi:hypothetical protein
MDEYESLNHTKWDCKYHVVRKTLFGHIRQHLGEVFHKLVAQKESRIEEGHLQPDHVHSPITRIWPVCISLAGRRMNTDEFQPHSRARSRTAAAKSGQSPFPSSFRHLIQSTSRRRPLFSFSAIAKITDFDRGFASFLAFFRLERDAECFGGFRFPSARGRCPKITS